MKLIHLSDLHIGKRMNEISLLDDQKHILSQIVGIVSASSPDAVVIAGDVYDKSVPPAEAVSLFDDFLYSLSLVCAQIFIIAGNHDSPERISFASRLLDRDGVHLAPVYSGHTEPVRLHDEYGEVRFYMLPFIKPASVRGFFPDADIQSYTDAVKAAVDEMAPDTALRNVLVTHQFVTGASRSDSEEVSVGGTDNVDAAVFGSFDYVALGHIHSPQSIGRQTVRYCGTPLKYSFSEAGRDKSVTVVTLGPKGEIRVDTAPLTPLHDLRELRGTYEELTSLKNYEGTATDDYLRITLTDEEEVPEAMNKLRLIYSNLLRLEYDNRRTRESMETGTDGGKQTRSPLEIFSQFYERQNNAPLTPEQTKYLSALTEKIWGDGE